MTDGRIVETALLHVKPSPSQVRAIEMLFRMCADLYNSHIESWVGSQTWRSVIIGKPGDLLSEDDLKIVNAGRDHFTKWTTLDDRISRAVLKQKHRAVGEYEAGGRPPCIIDPPLWDTVEIADPDWDMLLPPSANGKWWHLRIKGMPTLRFTDRRKRLLRARECQSPISDFQITRGQYAPFELHVATNWVNGVHQSIPPGWRTEMPASDTRVV